MNKSKKPEIVRERTPDIRLETEQYEIRADYGHYGISHYAVESAKTKKVIMKKFDKVLRGSRGIFVVLKPIALGNSKTVIKNYEQLPKIQYAVFTQKRDGIQYHGITIGVDRRDALQQVTGLGKFMWYLSRKDITLLLMENKKIKKDRFADCKVEDLSMTEKSISTPLKIPYFKIKGDSVERKEKEPIVVEAELY